MSLSIIPQSMSCRRPMCLTKVIESFFRNINMCLFKNCFLLKWWNCRKYRKKFKEFNFYFNKLLMIRKRSRSLNKPEQYVDDIIAVWKYWSTWIHKCTKKWNSVTNSKVAVRYISTDDMSTATIFAEYHPMIRCFCFLLSISIPNRFICKFIVMKSETVFL